jgi:hypothetical protein
MSDEVRALGTVAGRAATGLTRGIEQLHGAVATRAWRRSGPFGAPSKLAHDAIAAGVYGCVRAGLSAGAAAAGTVAGRVGEATGWPRPSETRTGGAALGVLNGLVGDRLHETGSSIGVTMAVRRSGRIVEPTPAALRGAFPAATGHVAVFVHGLIETERAWRWGGAHPDRPGVTYGSCLAADLGVTPVYLRYNTGRRVADNGRLLDELLDALVAAWPVPVERLALIGHSMGGLVIRSAGRRGEARTAPWVGLARHAVYLGTPHRGAPLARGGHRLGEVLDRLPETRPLASALRGLSAGIDDLRHGSLVDPDVAAEEGPDAWWAEVPLLAGCRHHAVSATVARRPGTPLDEIVGDLLVQVSSASGGDRRGARPDDGARVAFLVDDGLSVRGAHHLSLLNHPKVYERIRRWLSEPEPGAAGPGDALSS